MLIFTTSTTRDWMFKMTNGFGSERTFFGSIDRRDHNIMYELQTINHEPYINCVMKTNDQPSRRQTIQTMWFL